MKKILFLLLTVLLVFSLTACGDLNKILESLNVDEMMGNLGGNTTTKDGGTDTGTGEGEAIQDIEESQSVLYTLGLTKGYEITFTVSEEEEATLGYKDGVLWLNSDDSSSVYKKGEENLVHIFSSEEGEYVYHGSFEYDFEDMYKDVTSVIFSTAQIYESREYVNDGTEKVAGHTCTKYTSTFVYLNNYATVSVYVDVETGLILKIDFKESVNGETEEGTLLEVIELKVGEEITVPQVEVPEEIEIINYYNDSDSDGDEDFDFDDGEEDDYEEEK